MFWESDKIDAQLAAMESKPEGRVWFLVRWKNLKTFRKGHIAGFEARIDAYADFSFYYAFKRISFLMNFLEGFDGDIEGGGFIDWFQKVRESWEGKSHLIQKVLAKRRIPWGKYDSQSK